MRRYQKIRNVLLTVIVTLALQCTFEVCLGGYVDSNLVNGLNKLCGAFTVLDYTDLLTAAAVFVMLKEVKKREAKTDVATLVLSVILSFLLIVCISFKKYDSAIFLWGNSFQILLSTFCVLGFAVLLYLVLRLAYFGLEHVELPAEQGKKHLQMVGFFVIAFSWLFWILLNYPGTTSGDGLVQLKQFLGEQDWGAAHPPFSSAIIGICFVLGRTIADANFGFFLYCLMQTLVGAYAFSLSMKKLQELGISWKWCAVGILFFALTPFWGTYAQWFEKDLLYAEMTVLQAVYLMSVLKKKECGGKDAAGLIVFSVLSCLLRNNGIYAIVPALLLLAIYLKGKERRKAFLVLLATVVIYELITVVGYRALIDVGKPAASEGLSVPFQQTARYVCEYEDEVTEYERQVINDTLNFDAMKNYEPRISDPIKILYRGGDLGPYMGADVFQASGMLCGGICQQGLWLSGTGGTEHRGLGPAGVSGICAGTGNSSYIPHSDIGVSAADLVPQYAAAADQVSVYSGIVYLDSGSAGIFPVEKEKIQCVDTAGSRLYKRVGVPGIPHVQCNPL